MKWIELGSSHQFNCFSLWSRLLHNGLHDSSGGERSARVGESPADDNGPMLGDRVGAPPAGLTIVLQTSHIRTEEGSCGGRLEWRGCHQTVITVLVAQHKRLHLNLHTCTRDRAGKIDVVAYIRTNYTPIVRSSYTICLYQLYIINI